MLYFLTILRQTVLNENWVRSYLLGFVPQPNLHTSNNNWRAQPALLNYTISPSPLIKLISQPICSLTHNITNAIYTDKKIEAIKLCCEASANNLSTAKQVFENQTQDLRAKKTYAFKQTQEIILRAVTVSEIIAS